MDELEWLSPKGWRRRSFRRDAGSMGLMLGGLGGGLKAGGQLASGITAQREGKVAQQNSVLLGAQEQAQGQQKAIAEAAKAQQLEGRAAATGAASGAGSGTTIAAITGDLAAKGLYNEQAAVQEGSQRRATTEYAGLLAKMRGDNALKGSVLDAASTGLSTFGSMASRYGKTGNANTYDPSWSNTWTIPS